MHTERTNTHWPATSRRWLWLCLLGLLAAEQTQANPLPLPIRPLGHDKSKPPYPSLGRLAANLKTLSRYRLYTHVARDQAPRGSSKETSIVVAGSIISAIILGVAFFVYFRIYRECVTQRRRAAQMKRLRPLQLRPQQTSQQQPPGQGGMEEKKKEKKKADKAPRAPKAQSQRRSFDSHGQLLDRWLPRRGSDDDAASQTSGLEFGDLSATAPIGRTEPMAGPSVPPKAASRLGVEPNVPGSRPLTALLPDVPQTPEVPASYRFDDFLRPSGPASRRSASSMSTLGQELFQDTMGPPAPLRYESPAPSGRVASRGMEASSTLDEATSQRDRFRGTRYSMGENVI